MKTVKQIDKELEKGIEQIEKEIAEIMPVIEVKIRVPADVHEKITDRARRNDRSMNKEIVSILRRQK